MSKLLDYRQAVQHQVLKGGPVDPAEGWATDQAALNAILVAALETED